MSSLLQTATVADEQQLAAQIADIGRRRQKAIRQYRSIGLDGRVPIREVDAVRDEILSLRAQEAAARADLVNVQRHLAVLRTEEVAA